MADELRELIEKLGKPDPTANVLEHVRLIAEGLSNERIASDKYNEAQNRHVLEIGALRSEYEEKLAAEAEKRRESIRVIDAKSIELADTKLNNLGERLQTQFTSGFLAIGNQIRAIEQNQFLAQGEKSQKVEARQQNQWALGAGLTAVGLGIAFAAVVIALAQ